MGQYYKAINLDTMENVSPWDCKTAYKRADGLTTMIGQGAKLMEHSYIDNPFVGSVECLLTPAGKWHKARIVWAGDYADKEADQTDENTNLYVLSETAIKPKKRKLDKKYKYLCNHTLKVYLERPTSSPDDYTINPLCLLTCEGNGRGGGDYHGQDDAVGSWARHSLSYEEKAPAGYAKEYHEFAE